MARYKVKMRASGIEDFEADSLEAVLDRLFGTHITVWVIDEETGKNVFYANADRVRNEIIDKIAFGKDPT